MRELTIEEMKLVAGGRRGGGGRGHSGGGRGHHGHGHSAHGHRHGAHSTGKSVAFAGTLINTRYDETARVTHCTYQTPVGQYTVEVRGYYRCDPTSPAPRG